jgi:ribonuclease PH
MASSTLARADGRTFDALRPVTIEPNPLSFAEGSALISVGNTRVLCAATIEEKVPPWLRNQGRGWVTAEYSMLPRATDQALNLVRAAADLTTRGFTRVALLGRARQHRILGRYPFARSARSPI